MMTHSDTLQRFMFEHASIRGEIVHLDHSYHTIINQRNYPPIIKYLLGEALLSVTLLAGSVQFEGEVSLQFKGDDRIPLLLVQCDHELNLRGFAQFKAETPMEDYANAFLSGHLSLVMNPYQKNQAYQSIVPLQSTSIAENIMHYFAQSEQISTKIVLASNEKHAAGFLLQLLPTEKSEEREEFWAYATHLGETITDQELLSLENEVLLHRLYHETDVRIFPERLVKFQCRCNQDKMRQVLKVLGKQEVDELLKTQEKIEVTCDFCNQTYAFDAIDIRLLFN